ncbi:hypothetical protein PsorP6_019099 [Peronosclerospora sorghi]|nr:hypothetical protein PsorP6_019099 [Peronosclerospora sorghi]
MTLFSSTMSSQETRSAKSFHSSTTTGFLSSPQSFDALPSISPNAVYTHIWTPHELQILHIGLTKYPTDAFDNVTRYIKIAATLPQKCVRDVAFKVQTLGCLSGQTSVSSDVSVTKRMNQQSTTTELEEARLASLLQENLLAIHTIHANLVRGQLDGNRAEMLKFRDNCETVFSASLLLHLTCTEWSSLGDICTAMPPLPVQLDTSLLEDSVENINNDNNWKEQ